MKTNRTGTKGLSRSAASSARLAARLARALLAVGLAGLVAACSSAGGQQQLGATCDQFAATPAIAQSATIRVGQELQVTLCSNPSTGYTWEDPVVGDTSVVTVVATVDHQPGASLPIVGAAGGRTVTVKGAAAGTTTISLAYSRPWEGGEKGTWTYEAKITVEP